jgi:hypothetical protein
MVVKGVTKCDQMLKLGKNDLNDANFGKTVNYHHKNILRESQV